MQKRTYFLARTEGGTGKGLDLGKGGYHLDCKGSDMLAGHDRAGEKSGMKLGGTCVLYCGCSTREVVIKGESPVSRARAGS